MPFLYLLGTGAALSEPHRTTTMLAFASDDATLLVDCGGDVIQRMLVCGLPPASIEALILTHEHPDHVSGFPLFMEKIWLANRRYPIPVYGPRQALDQAARLFDAFDTSRWENLPEIQWHRVSLSEGAPVLQNELWKVTASPGEHSVPVIGLRVESRETRRTVVYSCDTGPSERIIRLAQGADILVHEATGREAGHSSIAQAAEIAARSQVGRLLLVHLPPEVTEDELEEARRLFPALELGDELGAYAF